MKTAYRFLLMFCLPVVVVNAASLDEADIRQLHSDISTMLNHFELGNAQPIIDKTHESLFAMVGGKEVFAETTREAIEELKQMGVNYISSKFGIPSQLYQAGDEELCFVPHFSIMEVEGQRVKSTGYMIAIRKRGSNQWKYLDGAGMSQNPQLLRELFPDLDGDIELPPHVVELQ